MLWICFVARIELYMCISVALFHERLLNFLLRTPPLLQGSPVINPGVIRERPSTLRDTHRRAPAHSGSSRSIYLTTPGASLSSPRNRRYLLEPRV